MKKFAPAITLAFALFYTFLWWVGGFDFNERGFLAAVFTASLMIISPLLFYLIHNEHP